MKYIANPVIVDAFRIVEVGPETSSPKLLALMLENGEYAAATEAMLARMTPEVGDYWVIQSDGYTYLNPKDVFERKYSRKVEYPITMYKLVDGRIETAAGIVDAAHEEIAGLNGWSREKPEAAAVSPVTSVEDRLRALEEKLWAIVGGKP